MPHAASATPSFKFELAMALVHSAGSLHTQYLLVHLATVPVSKIIQGIRQCVTAGHGELKFRFHP